MLQVTVLKPQSIGDLLSNIGGSFGLYLGGSIFSLIETFIVATLFLTSILGYFLKMAKK
jgi:hypothetical protein